VIGGGSGLVLALVFGGYVLVLLHRILHPPIHRGEDDSHRRLMDELRRYE
jgi:hypothetical protein